LVNSYVNNITETPVEGQFLDNTCYLKRVSLPENTETNKIFLLQIQDLKGLNSKQMQR